MVREGLREQVRKSRVATGLTMKNWMHETLTRQLPALVVDLVKLGIRPMSGKCRPSRLPLTDGLIAQLQAASAETGLPQSLLLLVAMGRQSASAKPARKRKAKTAAKA